MLPLGLGVHDINVEAQAAVDRASQYPANLRSRPPPPALPSHPSRCKAGAPRGRKSLATPVAPALLEGGFTPHHRHHPAYSRRASGPRDVQLAVARALSSMTVGAEIVGSLAADFSHGGGQLLRPGIVLAGRMATVCTALAAGPLPKTTAVGPTRPPRPDAWLCEWPSRRPPDPVPRFCVNR
jgi:hypothetical protein